MNMNSDQKKLFLKNICKSYKQHSNLVKVLSHFEFNDLYFLQDAVKHLIKNTMGATRNSEAVVKLLEQIGALPSTQQEQVAITALEVVAKNYFGHTSVLEKSFDVACAHATSYPFSTVFEDWAKSFGKRPLIRIYISRAPTHWQKDIECSVVSALSEELFPNGLFEFVSQVQVYPMENVVGTYMKNYLRTPDQALREMERVLSVPTTHQMHTFTQILLERFSHHPHFHKWDETVKLRYERVSVTLQRLVIEHHIGTTDVVSKARKI